MNQIDFLPIGRKVSQIGLGCGRLVGRSTLIQSARIVETALELGIRYFDVAPSYGMGTAEEVLGHVTGDSKEVVIATKVGIPRPHYSARNNFLRTAYKSFLDYVPSLKNYARRSYVSIMKKTLGKTRCRHDFSDKTISNSIEESLKRLKRDSVDVLLAHEPCNSDLTHETELLFQNLLKNKTISAFGVGIDACEDSCYSFGSIWQAGWPGDRIANYSGKPTHIFHGVIRYATGSKYSTTTKPANQLLLDATLQAPNSIILVSASTPRRLKDLLRYV